jgi:hypothetical protein
MAKTINGATVLGETLVHLHTLEAGLRRFLYECGQMGVTTVDLDALAVGDVLPSNPLTNGDSLRRLVEKYNTTVLAAHRESLTLDPALCDLREDLEQGSRIWSDEPADDVPLPVRLVKFSQPANGLVRCLSDQRIDRDRLQREAERLRDALKKVAVAGQEIHPQPGPFGH